jgi:hypothetical protein
LLAVAFVLVGCPGPHHSDSATAATGVATLTVVNNHCIKIVGGSMDNEYEAFTIQPGESQSGEVPIGRHTFEAWSEEGRHWTRGPVDVGPAGLTLTLEMQPPGAGCLKVVNSSGLTMTDLFLTTAPNGCTSSSWGIDRLGSSTIPSGQSVVVSGINQGSYDVRAVAGGLGWRGCGYPISAGATATLTMNPQ